MKKNKLIKLLKTGLLCFGVSLTLWNCEKEQISISEEVANNKVIVKNITLKQLEKKIGFEKEFIKLSKKFDTSQKYLASKNNSKEENYALSTTKILEVQNDGFKTYTFRIKKSDNNNQYFENLVVVSKNGTYEFYVYQYSFDINSEANLPYTITKNKIDKNTLDISSISKYLSKEESCGTTVEIEVVGEEYTCRCCKRKYIHPTCPSGYDSSPIYETVVTYLGSCGGESTGGNPFDNPNDNETTNDNFNCVDCNPHGVENNGNPAVGVVSPPDTFNNFAEEKLTTEQQTHINYFANRTFRGRLEFFLTNHNYSIEAENFVKTAIDAKIENKDVDINFEDKIINELTGKEKCAYDKLKALNLFVSTIKKFDNNKNYNLIIKRGNCKNSNTGCTDGRDISNGNITITMKEGVNGNPLGFASNLLHEGIHAEIFKYVDERIKGIDPNDRKNLMYYYWLEKQKGDPRYFDANYQHQHMADKYIQPITEALRKLDNYSYTSDYYLGFAWTGLHAYGFDKYWKDGKLVKLTKEMIAEYETKSGIVKNNTKFNGDDCK